MIVCGKLVSLKKLDCRLVQLQHDNFLQKPKALNVLSGSIYALSEVCDFCYLFFFTHEKGFE
jgi:hypothetical protein